MKTMNMNEMRKINGGGHYICTTGKCKNSAGGFVSTTKWTMGYHFLFWHTKEANAGRCTCEWVRW